MGTPIKFRQVKQENVITDISGLLEANRHYYGGVRVRCVAFRDEGVWQNALTVVKAFPLPLVPDEHHSMQYDKVHLLESWPGCDGLLPFVQSVVDGQMEIDGHSVSLAGSRVFQNVEQYPSLNELSQYPGHRYSSMGNATHNLPQDALLGYHPCFYSDVFDAMRQWTEMTSADRNHMGHVGAVYLSLPECRARFTDFTYSDGYLSMRVTGDHADGSDLWIKGAWGDGRYYTDVSRRASSSEVKVRVPPEAEELEVYLIGPDDTVYDWHWETPALAYGQGRILHGARARAAGEETVLQAIRKGEGPTIEFKPYIRPGDTKQGEIVRAAIAFANTAGGDILIGVDDQCRIVGIEHQISKDARGSGQSEEEAIQVYTGTLLQKIVGATNRSIDLEFEPVKVANHIVLRVGVPEGSEKPYFRLEDKATFVRRGANNVHADPDHDFPKLFKKPDLPF